MDKLKIAIVQAGDKTAGGELARQVFEDPALLELCTPVISDKAETQADADATVYIAAAESVVCPADAFEVVVTDTACFMPLTKEPTAEDIVKFRDILERDFDLRSPRIAIVQEGSTQNPDLASQVTAEQGINTYGPYTVEQMVAGERACHFDGIIAAGGIPTVQRIIKELSLEVPVRFFAGREIVVTAACQPVSINTTEDGLADVSALTHPIYIAIDVIRCRAFYDEARQKPLPKLFRDRREDRDKGENTKVDKSKAEDDGQ